MTDEEGGREGERGGDLPGQLLCAIMSIAIRSAKAVGNERERGSQRKQKRKSKHMLLICAPSSSFPPSSSPSAPLSLSLSVALFQVSPFDFNLTLTLTLVSPLSCSPSLCLPIGLTWQPQLELGKHYSAIHPSIVSITSHLSIVIISFALLSNQHNPVCVKDSKPRAVKGRERGR